jgi:nitroreductase
MDAMIFGAVQNGKKVEFERTVRTRNLVKKHFSENRPVKRETERSTPMNNIYTRVSIRKYQPKPVEPEKLEAILRAAMQAPSAANQQPWEFYVVTNKEKLAALSEVSPYAGMTKDAPVAIVAVYRRDCKLPSYAEIDMSIAMTNLWLETDAQGLGGVWLGIAPIEERMQAVEEVLELPERVRAFAIFPLGYPAEKRGQQDRFDPNRIHFVE